MSKLDKVLDEYHKYLMLRKLCKEEHAPYLVGWVRKFLRFARDKTGHKFETVIEMFRSRQWIHRERAHRTHRKCNYGLLIGFGSYGFEIKKFVL